MAPKVKYGKRIVLSFLLLIFVGIAVFFIWSFVNYRNDKDPHKSFLLPRLEIAVAKITFLTADRTNLDLSLLVKNDLPIGFTADSLVYGIYINDVEIVKDRYRKSIKLGRDASDRISLPITILNKHLKQVLSATKRSGRDSAAYRIRASLYTNILFKKKIDIDIKKVLPMISIPELNVEHIDLDSLNFHRAEFDLHLLIDNQNKFAFKAKDVAYRFTIADEETIVGVLPGLTDIKAEDKRSLVIPIRLSFKDVGHTLFQLLEKGKNIKYKLHLTLKVVSENSMIKESTVILESSGTVESILKATK